MLKKIGLPMMALAGTLAFTAPKPANAQVQFRVGVGVAPAYPYNPYVCSPYDPYCPAYVAPAPVPYVYGGGGRGYRDYDHDRGFRGRDSRGDFRGGEAFHGGGSYRGGGSFRGGSRGRR